jgi:asparagine N-glycosylation enzyme membrane subunit Stt3
MIGACASEKVCHSENYLGYYFSSRSVDTHSLNLFFFIFFAFFLFLFLGRLHRIVLFYFPFFSIFFGVLLLLLLISFRGGPLVFLFNLCLVLRITIFGVLF